MGEMWAVAYRENLPVEDARCLVDVRLARPSARGRDLLVRVAAVSVNPVDVKQRAGAATGGEPRVLGYDAAGVVEEAGGDCALFRPGDEVYYAGTIDRPGTNAEFHLVDERLVGRKPATLDFAEAAALPLTAITAWETLYDRFRLTPDSAGTLVVLGAAGGVGSLLVQLARRIPGLTVIGTASRTESAAWVRGLGAHHVVDHHGGLAEAVLEVAPDGVDHVFSPFSAGNVEAFARILKPRGQVVAIDEPPGLDLLPLKAKSISWHWELMFTRPLFEPADPAHHLLLTEVAALVDAGDVRTTLTRTLTPLDAATLREAHRLVETSASLGKIALLAR